MTTIDTTSPTFKSICDYVRSIPRIGRAFAWKDDPAGIALMVQQVFTVDPGAHHAAKAIGAACGFSGQAIPMFCRGLDSSNSVWPELRVHLKRLGVTWFPSKAEHRALKQESLPGRNPKSAATPAADAKPVAPVAVAPVADPVTKRSATLSVTPDGNVEIAKPPAKAEPQAVTKTAASPRNWRIDPATQDILETVTKRYVYGTGEHRAKMSAIMLQLGTASNGVK